MNQTTVTELYSSNKKLNESFNIFKKEHNDNIKTIMEKIDILDSKINKINENLISIININSKELNQIKKNINNNIKN